MRIAVLIVAAVAAIACQRPPERPEVQGARAAVIRYNERLPSAYRTGDQSLLGDAADEVEAGRIGAVIAGLAQRRQVMFARLVNLRMEQARMLDVGLVAVDTVETWTYEHRALADRDRPAPSKRETYKMTYQVGLQGQGGGWRVQSATVRE